MLPAFKIFVLIFLVISLGSFLIGLVRPVYVLWFLDRFNRLKVIKIYGLVSLFLVAIWLLMNLFE